MEKVFIKPAFKGAIVRHPEKINYVIPEEGEEVTLTPQWQRYIDAGDVVILKQEKTSTEKHTQEKQSKGENK